MHKRLKLYAIGCCILCITIIAFCIIYFIRGDTKNGISYITTLKIVEDSSNIHEIRISSKDSCKYYFLNDEEVKKISSLPIDYNASSSIFELPLVNEGYDVTSKDEPISELTWGSDLESSAKYIKYLELSGYSSLRSIYTPSYIEMYLSKGSIIKRILIFKESIMVGDLVQSFELPSLDKYLKF